MTTDATDPVPGGGEASEDAEETICWAELAAEAQQRLEGAGIADAAISARRIVEEASGFEGAEYVLALDRPATVRGVAAFDRMVARRMAGEPLQYVLGRWGFRTLDLLVDRRVLIPRPETEQVVGWALVEHDRLQIEAGDRSLVAVDLGTGSGAIALSLLAERRRTLVWATDVSADALAVAGANAAGLGMAATRLRLAEGSWFDALAPDQRGTIDLIVSNPPYVGAAEPLPPGVADWEPSGALVPGPTGLEDLERLVAEAPGWLSRPGALVVELAPDQAEAVRALALEAGFDPAVVADDHNGRHRAVIARIS